MEKDKVVEFQKINILLAYYGELLTDLQKDIIEKYYGFDLSLGEISLEKNISRSAVQDSLKKSIAKLEYFDQILKLRAKDIKLRELLKEAKKGNNQEVLQLIEKIERMIDYGI